MSDVIYSPAIYHTPENAPTEYLCRRLFIPDDLDWLALVNGALGTLGVVDFFTETEGGLTPEETCAEFLEMIVSSFEGCPEASTALKVAYSYYRKGNGLAPISLTAGIETVVPLNVEVDPDFIMTLAGSNAITPIAGEYELEATVALRDTGRSKLFWYTGSTHILKGTNADNADNHAHVSGRFSATGSQAYYLAVVPGATGTMGRVGSDSEEETYATLALRRLGD